MKDQITMSRHHRGWLVRWPAIWSDWDFQTYREKYFETSGIGDESGYRKAQWRKRELISELKEFKKSKYSSLQTAISHEFDVKQRKSTIFGHF